MVELLVALAVFATVMAGISVVFISSLRAWRTGQENRSVFQMARAATQFMERDITSAFGSVDRDEVKTLVGAGDWLTFVGITENPPTWRQISPDVEFEVPHSDMSRITYRLIRDPEVAGQFLLIRLVQMDVDDIVGDPFDLLDVTQRTLTAWNAIILDADPDAAPNVVPEDFELASNILGMEFRYGIIYPDDARNLVQMRLGQLSGRLEGIGYPVLAGSVALVADDLGTLPLDGWAVLGYVFQQLRDISNATAPEAEGARQAMLETMSALWDDTVIWYPGWTSLTRTDRKLPDVIEVRLSVRAAARMPTDETMRRMFTSRIFLPLGYRRPMPLALQ